MTHAAAASDTLGLLQRAEWQEQNGAPFEALSRVAYAKPWYLYMLRSTYGILGHTEMYRSLRALIPFSIVFASTVLILALRAARRRLSASEVILITTILFYITVLMQFTNYPAYRAFHELGMGVQGRYLFPLLLPVYGLIAKSLVSSSIRNLNVVIVVALTLLFVYGDFVFFVSEWG